MPIIKQKTFQLLIAVAALALIGASCSSKPALTTNNSLPMTNNVSITKGSFSPAEIIVLTGTAVTWTNNDTTAHTVTGNKDGPASENLAPGASYSFTFKAPGKYPYHSSVDTDMIGRVIVQPSQN